MKDEAVIRARINEQEKKAFEDVCKSKDLTASQVLRAFIRDYIKKNAQRSMF